MIHRMFFIFLLTPFFGLAQYSKAIKIKGQHIGVEVVGKEAVLAKKYSTCFNSNRYNAKQRRRFFPFNIASSVKIISFSPYSDTMVYTPISPGHYKLNLNSVKEIKELSASSIDSLTDLLYNVRYSPVKLNFKLIDLGKVCYNPRNAILFLNKNGEVTEYIELCFECKRYYLSSVKIKNTEYCDQKYDMLKAFFIKNSIKYGTQSYK